MDTPMPQDFISLKTFGRIGWAFAMVLLIGIIICGWTGNLTFSGPVVYLQTYVQNVSDVITYDADPRQITMDNADGMIVTRKYWKPYDRTHFSRQHHVIVVPVKWDAALAPSCDGDVHQKQLFQGSSVTYTVSEWEWNQWKCKDTIWFDAEK